MSTSGGFVIVGGGLAAARTAEQLRRSEYAGAVTIVSDEDHLPNVTGVYNTAAYAEMLELIQQVRPDARVLGTLFVPA